jgi:hypothetical protein
MSESLGVTRHVRSLAWIGGKEFLAGTPSGRRLGLTRVSTEGFELRHLPCMPWSLEQRRTSADDCPWWSGRYGLTQPVASTGGRAMDARSDHLLANRVDEGAG